MWLRAVKYRLTSGDAEQARRTLDRSLQVDEGSMQGLGRAAGAPTRAAHWGGTRCRGCVIHAGVHVYCNLQPAHLQPASAALPAPACLQSLPKFEHIRMISQTGLLEFKLGDAGGWAAHAAGLGIALHSLAAISCAGNACASWAGLDLAREPACLPFTANRAAPAPVPAAPCAERGRSVFEGVLRNYPKRLDLWSVYLDQEVALGDAQRIR